MIKVLQINIDLGKHKAGSKVKVKCTDEGIPLDVFWRRRLKDARVDSCVEWVEEKKITEKKSSSKSTKGEKS